VGVLSIQMLSTAALRAFRNLAHFLPALKSEGFGCNPDLALQKIYESLSKNFWRKSFRMYLEEQSDKNYYIVLAVSEAPADKGVR
jgi:hypothetical protein